MTKQEYLHKVRQQIYYIFDRNAIEEELTQHIEDLNGKNLNESSFTSGSILGNIGYKEFSLPQDNLIYIVTRDDQRIAIDLEEYANEKN